MNVPARFFVSFAAALLLGAGPFAYASGRLCQTAADAQSAGEQGGLVDRAIAREQAVIKIVKARTPLVETYIQNMRPDDVMREVPESDAHFLGKVQFSRVIGNAEFAQGPKAGSKGKPDHAALKSSIRFVKNLGGSMHLEFSETGFVQMLLMDSNSFDREHYVFTFVRNDFLGTVPTAVYDVRPVAKHSIGRYFGRMWVERQNGNVVRFNGDFSGSERGLNEFYHFDSWRTNVQPGVWLPTSFYAEDKDPKSATNTLKLKAVGHIWGYALKEPGEAAVNTDVEVVGTTDVSAESSDCSGRCAQRAFDKMASENVVERLYQAGLLDAPSDFDKTLETLANNILAYNKIPISNPIRVRTLLTEPLESFSVGNTIILSKSLIDTSAVVTADDAARIGNLTALLAFQLGHILTGHHIDTKYAFTDKVLFPDTTTFQRLPMHHSDDENVEAARQAIELLNAPEVAGAQKYFGLYLEQLQERIKSLKALNDPLLGDGLASSGPDPKFWMQALMPKAERLDDKDLKQQGAVTLSSFLRFDPWTDQVIANPLAFSPVLSASDKMPFEIAPVFIKLAYFDPNADPNAPQTPAAAVPVAKP